VSTTLGLVGFTGTLLMKLAGPLTVDQDSRLQNAPNPDDALEIARNAKPRLIWTRSARHDKIGSGPQRNSVCSDLRERTDPGRKTSRDCRRCRAGMLIRPLDPERMLEYFAEFLRREEE